MLRLLHNRLTNECYYCSGLESNGGKIIHKQLSVFSCSYVSASGLFGSLLHSSVWVTTTSLVTRNIQYLSKRPLVFTEATWKIRQSVVVLSLCISEGGIRRSNRVLHQITSDAPFVGSTKLRMSSSTSNKIRIAFDCHTRSVIIYAFLPALHRLGERSEIPTPPQVNMALTYAIPSYPKNKLVNRVSLISKMLPLAGPNLLQQIDGITRVTEGNAHEITALHWGVLVGLSPAVALSFIADNSSELDFWVDRWNLFSVCHRW
ncbi:unnamed protein product [Orchesella dallaii]|uniref:Uncharacterized protein n=1 Tax=Orchesella dallaii TaxID=48710 RepID=A0ABP1Q2T2_9HEXA